HDLTAVIKRLTSLIDSGRAMSSIHAISELLDFFIEQVVSELGVERASIMLVNERREELYIAASRGISRDVVESVSVKLGDGIAGKVAQTGKPILVTDVTSDPRVKEIRDPKSSCFISLPIVLSIPITYQEKVLGVINATNRRSGETFTENDISFLLGLAGQASVAIENARQFEELKDAYESLRSTQKQLVSSERLNALGQMAAGIAHDFNNILNGILGNIQLLVWKITGKYIDAGMIQSELRTIERIALQGAETVKRIQDFSGIRKDTPVEEVNLNALVHNALDVTRHKWKDECEVRGTNIDIRLNLNDIPPTQGNKFELIQVICNLIFNAVEAMPQGGALGIITARKDGRILLTVSDTGIGMNEETRARILEPFFTTKEKGHGLGLSIVYGILKRHQGDIAIASEERKGTTVTISLPVIAGIEQKRVPEGNGRQGSAAKARVLVIDDSDQNRMISQEALTIAGHDVVCAETGMQGLSLFEQEHFDVIITDLSMAGLSGLEVAKRAKKIDPQVPIILLSGWAAQQDQEQLRADGIDYVLSKPCSLDRLQGAVDEALNASPRIKDTEEKKN
ncbi:MAG: ATP-binding protein, partial [bacterium]